MPDYLARELLLQKSRNDGTAGVRDPSRFELLGFNCQE
jgi:hypothetical protein